MRFTPFCVVPSQHPPAAALIVALLRLDAGDIVWQQRRKNILNSIIEISLAIKTYLSELTNI